MDELNKASAAIAKDWIDRAEAYAKTAQEERSRADNLETELKAWMEANENWEAIVAGLRKQLAQAPQWKRTSEHEPTENFNDMLIVYSPARSYFRAAVYRNGEFLDATNETFYIPMVEWFMEIKRPEGAKS